MPSVHKAIKKIHITNFILKYQTSTFYVSK